MKRPLGKIAAIGVIVLLPTGCAGFASTNGTEQSQPTASNLHAHSEASDGKYVELDQFGQPLPQRVQVDVGVYPSVEGTCSTLDLPRIDPFCGNISDRALTDRHVADYMARQAAAIIAPNSQGASAGFDLDAIHWLRQVVATPVEEGGPSLELRSEFLEILDRWLTNDLTHIEQDWNALRTFLD